MPTYANTTPTAFKDGVNYCTSAPIPATAADNDLGSPQPVVFGEAILADAAIAFTGGPSGNTGMWVILQTDLNNDGNWLDVAWGYSTANTGTVLFYLSAGVAGANAAAQTRAAGAAPGAPASGSNQVPLGGRIRFVGRAQLTGGTSPMALATINFKRLGLR